MSSGGQIVGGIVGAVVGFLVTWNPYGALQGAAIGAAIGGYLDPPKGPTVSGPRLADQTVQTSTYGAFIPRIYGTISASGNLLWLENNKLKETVRKEESGSKGGGSSSTLETFSYSATFALGLCQGPIAGIKRIWCADKLIYNVGSDDLQTILASNAAESGFTFYNGSDSQEPDPRYEADVGVGNAPSYRGMAYIVFEDFKLADYSNTLQVAQFKFELVSEGGAINILIDEIPNTNDDFDLKSVFGALPDQYGLGILDSATSISVDGEATYTTRAFSLGRLTSESEPFEVTDIKSTATPRAVRSSDEKNWVQYTSNDTFADAVYLKSDDNLAFSVGANAFAQDMILHSITGSGVTPDQYNYYYSYSSIAGDGQPLTDIAYTATFKDLLPPAGIIRNLNESSGWNISTAGDEPFEWAITGAPTAAKTLNVRIYDANLSTPVATFSGALPAEWPPKTDGNKQVAKVAVRIVNRTLYLVCKDRTDDNYYRYAAVDSTGTLFEYSFTTPNALGEDLIALWPFNSEQGLMQTENRIVQWRRYYSGGTPLASIIDAECAITNVLTAAEVDTSLINETVDGYRVLGGTVRAALEPLQGAWPFDVRSHGYKIQCLPRGQSSVVTIPWEDLGATDGDKAENLIKQTREMDSQLPYRVNIKYLDAAREYAISEQYAERLNTETVNRVDREFPLSMNANKAAGVAEVLLFLPWLERVDFSFSIPQPYQNLEPGDVVTVEDKTATYQLRLVDINYTSYGCLECVAKLNDAALYLPNAEGAEAPGPDGTIPLAGPSIFIPLDVPVVDELVQDRPGFIGAMTGITTGWPGAILIRSTDEGQTWAELQAFNGKATIGVARSTLAVSNATMIDQSSLTVELVSGSLSSITKDQMLAGSNYIAYGVDGRWEIMRFQTATLQPDESYIVSGFLRGERGTEWATGLHELSDLFVLMDDPDMAFMGAAVGSIGADLTYRAITSGQSIDSASDQIYAYDGVNLECLSPVYARGTRDGSSNFTGTFTRRSRLSSSWWATGVVAPVGEVSESYEVDVMNASVVERTISVTSPTFSYSAADQTTDFGSPQSSITFKIYQLSGTVGRGYPYEVTL